MKTLRRNQTTASQGLGVLRLLGSNSPHSYELTHSYEEGLVSPYFQQARETREEAPGRNILLFLTYMMKAIIVEHKISSTSIQLDFLLIDTDGVTNLGGQTTSFTPTAPFTRAHMLAEATTQMLAWGAINGWDYDAGNIIDYSAMVDGVAPLESALTGLSVQTSTGAVGTQVSADRDALVVVNASESTTASIAGNAALDLVLEVAPTNSVTAGDWVEKGRVGNSQALSLAVTLQSVQGIKGPMVAFVPKGYYVKVRSTGASGTHSESVVNARKVLF